MCIDLNHMYARLHFFIIDALPYAYELTKYHTLQGSKNGRFSFLSLHSFYPSWWDNVLSPTPKASFFLPSVILLMTSW